MVLGGSLWGWCVSSPQAWTLLEHRFWSPKREYFHQQTKEAVWSPLGHFRGLMSVNETAKEGGGN